MPWNACRDGHWSCPHPYTLLSQQVLLSSLNIHHRADPFLVIPASSRGSICAFMNFLHAVLIVYTYVFTYLLSRKQRFMVIIILDHPPQADLYGPRVHAECILHSARPRVLHSTGGPYITFIAKQIDENSAGTQLYRQRVCFFLPLCLLALYQHNLCNFLKKGG